jgi:hypothetical protein
MNIGGLLFLLMSSSLARADSSETSTELLNMGIRPILDGSSQLADELDTELRDSMERRQELGAFNLDSDRCGERNLQSCLLEEGLDAGAQMAFGGQVVDDAPLRVEVMVIDVGSEDLVVAFELSPSQEVEALGEDLARLLLGVMTEDIDPLEDLRFDVGEGVSSEHRLDIEAALQNRLSDAWTLELTRLLEPIALEKIATADQDRSTLPPWEQIGMEPQEYGLYRASGMSLEAWREDFGDGSWQTQVGGRQGRLIIRPTVGVGMLPHASRYDGWYLLEASDTSWTASAAWVGRESGLGADVLMWFGFGLTPVLEVDLGIGVAPARYSSSIQLEIPGDAQYDPSADQTTVLDKIVGARVFLVPNPIKSKRPLVGAGLRYLMGPETPEILLPTESSMLPAMAGSQLGLVEFIGGLELQTRGGRDLMIAVPVGLGVLGQEGETYEAGNVEAITADRERSSPSLSVGLELGVGFRIRGSD